MSVYRFIAAQRATFGVKMLCRHLGVSTSAFYDWQRRPPSRRELDNRALTRRIRRIREIHESSRGTYGAPRIIAELRADGIRVTRKRVARLMREARLQGVHIRRRRWRKAPGELGPHRTGSAGASSTEAPDLVWVADIMRRARARQLPRISSHVQRATNRSVRSHPCQSHASTSFLNLTLAETRGNAFLPGT